MIQGTNSQNFKSPLPLLPAGDSDVSLITCVQYWTDVEDVGPSPTLYKSNLIQEFCVCWAYPIES